MPDALDEIAASTGNVAASDPQGGLDHARRWAFFTNHFAVLACVASDPEMRMRDIATATGITERAAQAILHDLVEAGYVERHRIGRRNHYAVRRSEALRRTLFPNVTVGDVLEVVLGPERTD